jgi:Ulp1 family protease
MPSVPGKTMEDKIVLYVQIYILRKLSREGINHKNIHCIPKHVHVVEQSNVVDCGVYMLEYIERFMQHKDIDNLTVYMKFSSDHIKNKRLIIYDILRSFKTNGTMNDLPAIQEASYYDDNEPSVKQLTLRIYKSATP